MSSLSFFASSDIFVSFRNSNFSFVIDSFITKILVQCNNFVKNTNNCKFISV